MFVIIILIKLFKNVKVILWYSLDEITEPPKSSYWKQYFKGNCEFLLLLFFKTKSGKNMC